MKKLTTLLWFRRDLRLHDHPALLHAVSTSATLFPVYCLEVPTKKRCGHLRWLFLLESLADLDSQLRALGSRLFVVRGKAPDVLPQLVKAWAVDQVLVQSSPEPFARARDEEVAQRVAKEGGEFHGFPGRTLFEVSQLLAGAGNGASDKGIPLPVTMTGFAKVADRLTVPKPEPAPTSIPLPLDSESALHQLKSLLDPVSFASLTGPHHDLSLPRISPTDHTVPELGLLTPLAARSPHTGGESHALARLDTYMSHTAKVLAFEKPKTSPAALPDPVTGLVDTTVLSPYMTYGCLSPRLFHSRITSAYRAAKGKHSKPPVSLLAQLYWREFFFAHGATVDGFELATEANPTCPTPIDWRLLSAADSDPEAHDDLKAWAEARTGYPWIDACMTQLRSEGWIHHLGRHSLACFLTRGDLYISWERGAEVFEDVLLDHDWALNRGNWAWLSGTSVFFRQWFRVYSPVKWGQSWDAEGKYIKRHLPQLAKFPKQYIYEPWKAPLAVQKQAGCIVGKDYPKPIVDHAEASKANMAKLKACFARGRDKNGAGEDEGDADEDIEKDKVGSSRAGRAAARDRVKRK
ncbi:FAD binding domain of DNA photolyase-domain-containing protein [Catenaria anguillulae PL171]|uniref:FAD binding domain of DNA photolyase-domain-containing protein n=1 Tax=Catenaria anguillulae PL171 TaxID=765915 RepID=A0A1Y2HA27_9FUNG|nr:FAD binding domain of DNA photolyase-domain-containing protein [Catenaria anguillulae PL171]